MPIVEKRVKGKLISGNEALQEGEMLKTIILSQDPHVLSRRLPKSNYERPLKQCPSIPEVIHEEELERKINSSHQSTPTNINIKKKAIEELPPKPKEISKQIKPQEKVKNELPPKNPDQQRGKPPIQQVSRPPYHKHQVQKHTGKRRPESSQKRHKYQPKPMYSFITKNRDENPPLTDRNPSGNKIHQVRNPSNQKVQRRAGSVGGGKRQDSNRKLVEYCKQNPVRPEINIRVSEDNKKKSPTQKMKTPQNAGKKPPAVNGGPNVYPSWWG